MAEKRGIFWSELDEPAYTTYDRELFIATLNDWGWHGGDDGAPEWYTGAAWTT